MEERMGHEAEIIIPGSFVALQGTPGDGIINTVETTSTTWHWNRHHPARIDSGDSSQGMEDEDDDDDDAVIPIATTPRSNAATSTATTTSTTNLLPVPTEDSYVVIVNDTDTNDEEGQEQQEQQHSPREDYHRHCLQQALAKREEWKDSARSMATDHLFWTSSNDHHDNNNNTTSNNNDNGDDDSFWWLQRGKVAILKELPTKLSNGTILRSVMGTIAPGSTIVATDICFLHSQTLQRCQVAPITSSGGTTSPPHRIYPRAQVGWVVLVKLEHHGRIGYATLSVDGYPLLAPGLPSWYTDPHCWIWRVTCPLGAFVRQGLNLNTQHLDTIPFGTLVRVTQRTINTQGLSRLRVSAVVEDDLAHPTQTRLVEGWCSEFLNPLSGSRGSVLTPLTFPVPVLYRIVLAAGAVVRSNVELSSPIQRQLPYGTIVPIQSRAFSEHPVEQCLHRLQLVAISSPSSTTTTNASLEPAAAAAAGGGGWISLKLNQAPPHDTMVVEYVSLDPNFYPDAPHLYHMANYQSSSLIHEHVRRGVEQGDGELSSIDSEAGSSELSAWSPLPPPPPASRKATLTTTAATTSGTAGSTTITSQCVICLTQERNATIVHGETGHVACCLVCARILKARGDKCPVCRLPIDLVIQHFWA